MRIRLKVSPKVKEQVGIILDQPTSEAIANIAQMANPNAAQITVLDLPKHNSGQHRSKVTTSNMTFEFRGVNFKFHINDTHAIHFKHQDIPSFVRLFKFLSIPNNLGKELTVDANIEDFNNEITESDVF